MGAKRVVLDTIESLFAGLQNETILRAELRRLFRWLRDRDLTVVITGEKGERTLTRHGLEEYVSDAVIQLDHRVDDQISTRRIRVVKYRGSHHGTNEYPFLIDEDGLSRAARHLAAPAARGLVGRVSSGLPRARPDAGGSRVLPRQHGAGVGHRRHRQDDPGGALCRRRLPARRAVPVLPLRGVAAADGAQHARRPASTCSPGSTAASSSSTRTGPRASGWKRIWSRCTAPSNSFRPDVVVVDPMTNLLTVGTQTDVRAMLTRIIDFLKTRGRHGVFTALTSGGVEMATTETMISSLMDTWILITTEQVAAPAPALALRAEVARHGALRRDTREFRITDHGIDILAAPGRPAEER